MCVSKLYIPKYTGKNKIVGALYINSNIKGHLRWKRDEEVP